MDPSESNIFDWGSELLLHRTLEPAIEVFSHGAERYPDSPRMAIGLGMAYYSLGKYDDAVKSLLRAADLSPSDPRGYPFLSAPSIVPRARPKKSSSAFAATPNSSPTTAKPSISMP